MSNIGIINLGISNIKSIYNAFESLGYDVKLINQASDLSNVSHLILPGVGSFTSAMSEIKKKDLISGIYKFKETGKYILGICLVR